METGGNPLKLGCRAGLAGVVRLAAWGLVLCLPKAVFGQRLGAGQMFIPLYDIDNPVKHIRFQFVTLGLVLLNVVIFVVYQSGLVLPPDMGALVSFSVIPVELMGTVPAIPQGGASFPGAVIPQSVGVPEFFTPITYQFLHGGWLHLIGNMLFLWVFGDNVEDAMGHGKFLVFYLLCGVIAGLVHSVMLVNSDVPMIGASGAVAGVIAAYLMLHPRVRVWVLVLMRIPVRIPAAIVLGLWVVMQVASVVIEQDSNTAWWAHIGGLIAGAVLILFMRRPGVALFDKGLPSAAA